MSCDLVPRGCRAQFGVRAREAAGWSTGSCSGSRRTLVRRICTQQSFNSVRTPRRNLFLLD